MNDHLLHRLFGFICASVGLVVAITGGMFWLDPPDFPIVDWGLAVLMVGGVLVMLAGIGVALKQPIARYAMVGLAVFGVLGVLGGVGRAILGGNLAAAIIVLTALMPLILVISVMIELGRPASPDH